MIHRRSQPAAPARRIPAWLGVLLLGLAITPASQAEDGGWYLGTRFDTTLAAEDTTDFDLDTAPAPAPTGWRLYGGYRFNPHWAIEAKLQDHDLDGLGGIDTAYSGDSFLDDGRSLQLTGAATLPINSGFSLFGRVGMQHWDNRQSNGFHHDFGGLYGGNRGTDFSLGAGGYYLLGDNLSLRADWDHYFIDQTEIDLFSARLNYRFK